MAKRLERQLNSLATIYIMYDPRPGNPTFYIGSTSLTPEKALKWHLYEYRLIERIAENYGQPTQAQMKERHQWIKELDLEGLKPLVKAINQVPGRERRINKSDMILSLRAIRGESSCTNKQIRTAHYSTWCRNLPR